MKNSLIPYRLPASGYPAFLFSPTNLRRRSFYFISIITQNTTLVLHHDQPTNQHACIYHTYIQLSFFRFFLFSYLVYFTIWFLCVCNNIMLAIFFLFSIVLLYNHTSFPLFSFYSHFILLYSPSCLFVSILFISFLWFRYPFHPSIPSLHPSPPNPIINIRYS